MAVIGNNGKWYALKKNSGFDWIDFERKAFFIDDSAFTETILKGAEKYGFTYYEK